MDRTTTSPGAARTGEHAQNGGARSLVKGAGRMGTVLPDTRKSTPSASDLADAIALADRLSDLLARLAIEAGRQPVAPPVAGKSGRSMKAVPVVATDPNGNVTRYPSQKAAERDGHSRWNIWSCRHGKRATHHGREWKEVAP